MTIKQDPFRPLVKGKPFTWEEPDVEPQTPEPEQVAIVIAEVTEELPVGTTKELLAWVGADKDRAQKVLDLEKADAKPRAGLVKALNEILEG